MKTQNVQLDSLTHIYTVDGVEADTSVTQFIAQYHDKFEPDAILTKIGIIDPIVRAEKKREWAVSAPEGTFVHAVLEQFVKGNYTPDSMSDAGYAKTPLQIASGIRALNELKSQIGDGWEWNAEWMSSFKASDDRVVAGTMDLLLVNDTKKEVIIIDYKTCKSLTRDAYGNKFFAPIEKTPASKFHKYSLQTEIYGYMVTQALPGYTIKSKLLLQLKPDGEIKWLQCKDMNKEFELIR